GVLDGHPRRGLVVLELDALELVIVDAEILVDDVLLLEEPLASRRRDVIGRHVVLAPADAFLERPHVGEEVLGATGGAAAGDEPEQGEPAHVHAFLRRSAARSAAPSSRVATMTTR